MKKRYVFIILIIIFNLFFCIFNMFNIGFNYYTPLFIFSIVAIVAILLLLIFSIILIKPIFEYLYRKIIPKKGEKKIRVGRYGFTNVQEHMSKQQFFNGIIRAIISFGVISTLINVAVFFVILF